MRKSRNRAVATQKFRSAGAGNNHDIEVMPGAERRKANFERFLGEGCGVQILRGAERRGPDFRLSGTRKGRFYARF